MEKTTINAGRQFNEERFTKIDIIKNRDGMTFVLNFLPGQEMKAHSHPNRQLYLHVLEGAGTLSVDGKVLAVAKGDVVYFESDEQIGFVNTGEENVSIHGVMTKI